MKESFSMKRHDFSNATLMRFSAALSCSGGVQFLAKNSAIGYINKTQGHQNCKAAR